MPVVMLVLEFVKVLEKHHTHAVQMCLCMSNPTLCNEVEHLSQIGTRSNYNQNPQSYK